MRRFFDVAALTRPNRIRFRPAIRHLSPSELQRASYTLPAPKPSERSTDYRQVYRSRTSDHEDADYEDALEAKRRNTAIPEEHDFPDENTAGPSIPTVTREVRARSPRAKKLPSLLKGDGYSSTKDQSVGRSKALAEPSADRGAPSSGPKVKGKQKAVESAGGPEVLEGPQRKLRRNPVGVQLLSPSLHSQLFPGDPLPQPPDHLLRISREHLKNNGLSPDDAAVLPEIDFDMPPLQGKSIKQHFLSLGKETAEPYLSMAEDFVRLELLSIPESWEMGKPGWTKYGRDGSVQAVQDLGDETIVCFDVETLYKLSPYPVMATAATPNAWYSWLSPTLFEPPPNEPDPKRAFWDTRTPKHHCHDLIPLFSSDHERIVIGHNVGYDRQRVKEEYDLSRSATGWIDTLSLHVATRGITSVQRPAWLKHKKSKTEAKMHESEARAILMEEAESEGDEAFLQDLQHWGNGAESEMEALRNRWEDVTSVNSLADVAALHCKIPVDKSIRDHFGDDAITHASQLLPDLHKLITYCATDVKTTHEVYKKVFPLFRESCPHPASFAGVLTMGSSFLPVDDKWETYLEDAETKYREMDAGVKKALRVLAEKLRNEGEKEGDVWAEQLDWTPKTARWADDDAIRGEIPTVPSAVDEQTSSKPETATASQASPPLVTLSPAITAKIPAWYAPIKDDPSILLDNKHQRYVLPLVLRLSYKSHPVVYLRDYWWCFLVPEDHMGDYLDAHGGPVHPGPKDKMPEGVMGDHVLFRISGPDEPRKSKLTGPGVKAMISKGELSGPYLDLLSMLVKPNPGDVTATLFDCVEKLRELGKQDIWGSQLDWSDVASGSSTPELPPDSPVSSSAPDRPSSRSGRASKSGVGTWPKWYWDLTGPKSSTSIPFGELDLTTKKTLAPLLLRLQWQGHPLYHDKTHKWLYRIPVAEAEEHETASAVINDGEYLLCRLPHKDGEGKNVGNPLSKSFVKSIESGELSSTAAAEGDDIARQAASDATNMNVLCSYWMSSRERIKEQMVVYSDAARTKGMILPRVITMGTVTRRAVESTWLTASNAKKNRVGSELKAMVRAPPGYSLVGADVDSEELWISSVMGDSQFACHGATAIGWMTLEGTKAAGTDLHSKTANILGISRDGAKVFNYSRIYGAGQKHAIQLLLQGDASLTKEAAAQRAKELYKATKGSKATRSSSLPPSSQPNMWYGGSESFLFNTLEAIALSDRPTTPALGCGVTRALRRSYLEETSSYLPSRINWVVQSSGVDYLHLLIVSMEYLIKTYDISARYLISVHDEVRYLAKEDDRYRCALALQIANAWTRALFCYNLGMSDMPQGVAFFSAVDVDHVLRKEVFMSCETPSHPTAIPAGESFDIAQILEKTGGSLGHHKWTSEARGEIKDPGQSTRLFPNLASGEHRMYLEAQAGTIGAPAKRWLDAQPAMAGMENVPLSTVRKVFRTVKRGNTAKRASRAKTLTAIRAVAARGDAHQEGEDDDPFADVVLSDLASDKPKQKHRERGTTGA